MTQVQGSFLDLASGPEPQPIADGAERTPLAEGAWIDLRRQWLSGGRAAELFESLRDGVAWKAERRRMYDRIVDVPRLVAFFGEESVLPDRFLADLRDNLSEYYVAEPGGPFRTVGLCHYRDGHDSVAWHGDTNGRGATDDTTVAILSLGAGRRLLLRPRRGGGSLRFELESGDLLVMGGSCQRTWEHPIPKTARPIGPRISVQFRQQGVS